MVVIISETDRFIPIDLKASIFKGLNIIKVETSDELIDALEKNSNESILLFSNFPSDNYPSEKAILRASDNDNYYKKEIQKPLSYSKTSSLFSTMARKYSFKAIHIITGAPESIVNEKFLKELLPGIKLTLKRKNDLHNTGEYFSAFTNYVTEKIKDEM